MKKYRLVIATVACLIAAGAGIAQVNPTPSPDPWADGQLDEIMARARLLAEKAGREVSAFDMDQIGAISEEARQMAARIKPQMAELMRDQLPLMAQMKPLMPHIQLGDRLFGNSSEDNMYRTGTSHLDRRDWEKAVDAFDSVIAGNGARADAAYYWKAYAQAKLGRRDNASATIAELQSKHPKSRWLNDAKALDLEIKQASGQRLSPETQSDEDLKLMAINSLMQSDPERAIPLLEKVLAANSSPKLRERALFVLAQSRSPKARDVVVTYAKGKGNPDLQMRAVEYLGAYNGRENLQVLRDVYSSSSDAALKRRILRSFTFAGDKEILFGIAKNEQNVDLRREAIRQLGMMGGAEQLGQLYSSESAIEAREEILRAFAMSGDSSRVIEVARVDKEPRLRRQAIRSLGTMGRNAAAAETLVSLYGSESDASIKKEIQRALFAQGNTKALINIARSESDPTLKREAVQQLSTMRSKEATDFMMEILNK